MCSYGECIGKDALKRRSVCVFHMCNVYNATHIIQCNTQQATQNTHNTQCVLYIHPTTHPTTSFLYTPNNTPNNIPSIASSASLRVV